MRATSQSQTCANLSFRRRLTRGCSSDGQSSGFLNRVSGVRVSPAPPSFRWDNEGFPLVSFHRRFPWRLIDGKFQQKEV